MLKKLNDPAFWATQGVKYATGAGLIMGVSSFAFKTDQVPRRPDCIRSSFTGAQSLNRDSLRISVSIVSMMGSTLIFAGMRNFR